MKEAVGHGKIILFGEHAVVHGCPALAMALPRGAVAQAEVADVDRLYVSSPSFKSEIVLDGRKPLEQAKAGASEAVVKKLAELHEAFEKVLPERSVDRPKLSVRAELHVPAGAGLGGSAALSVAVIRAIDRALGRARSDDDVFHASMDWEGVYHGTPSGVDSAMATFGGLAVFRRGEKLVQTPVAKLPVLVVGHSGSAPSTRAMVESVARQLKQDPDRVGGLFKGIERIVNAGRVALENADWPALGRLMNDNHTALSELGLSTSRLDGMCDAAMQAGALGAKLTGGGGGGCMVALAPDAASAEAIKTCLSADRAEDSVAPFVVGAGDES